MSYTITPSPFTSGEVLVLMDPKAPLGEIIRGRDLASALRGRYSVKARGHMMTVKRAEKWKTLFDSGWSATVHYMYNVKTFAYVRGGEKFTCLYDVMKSTRTFNPKPLEV